MVKLTVLNYWHSFRPPERLSLFVAAQDVVAIRDLPFDERRSESVCQITLTDGQTHTVEGNAAAVASQLEGTGT